MSVDYFLYIAVGMEPVAKIQLIRSLVKLLEDVGIVSAVVASDEVRKMHCVSVQVVIMRRLGGYPVT